MCSVGGYIYKKGQAALGKMEKMPDNVVKKLIFPQKNGNLQEGNVYFCEQASIFGARKGESRIDDFYGTQRHLQSVNI